MKILHYVLGVNLLISCIDVVVTTTSLYACPRCRRALPKGPRKLPHPGFSNKHKEPANNVKNNEKEPANPCSHSYCCAQKKLDSLNSKETSGESE